MNIIDHNNFKLNHLIPVGDQDRKINTHQADE